MRKMIAQYRGTCKTCNGRISPGETIYWAKGHLVHERCYKPEPKPKPKQGRKGHFLIDWSDLRDFLLDTMNGKGNPPFRITRNAQTWEGIVNAGDLGFQGYSRAQMKDWLENGYESEGLRGIQDFAPPIREKRRFVYSDEGDEIDLSAAWSGEDNFMTQWTKRDVIPGVAITFSMNFGGGVSATVVNAYTHWIAQAIFAIEAAGIDPEVSLADWSRWRWSNGKYPDGGVTQIRVKKEGETVDQSHWSAMLSPAAYRTFDFAAIVLAGDSIGVHVDSGIDGVIMGQQWGVKYDSELAEIQVSTPPASIDFPEEEMTKQLRDAIEELKKGN